MKSLSCLMVVAVALLLRKTSLWTENVSKIAYQMKGKKILKPLQHLIILSAMEFRGILDK